MATYKITAPDGNSYQVTAPDTASQDEVLAYARDNYGKASGPTDYKQIIGQSMKDVFQRPAAFAKDLGTNPVTMAQAIPPLAGIAGAISPVPGAATLATVGGRQMSNAALNALGRQDLVPSGMSQAIEGATVGLGDVSAIPAMKSAYFGKQIANAERAAGELGGLVKEAPPSGMRTAVKYVQSLKNKPFMTPAEARAAKPALQTIWDKGWLNGTEYSSDLQKVQAKVTNLINQIPGRAEPAAAMGVANTIPRLIKQGYNAIPSSAKRGMGFGAGATGTAGVGYGAFQLIKKLLGG